jgi:heptosyltransferase-2
VGDPAAPRRILIRCPNPLGDAVMATPVFRAVRRAHPEAEIVVMGPPHHAGLLRDLPHFDRYLPVAGRGLRDIGRRARQLREFDWALVLPDSPRTALEPYLARIPTRVGYARDVLRRHMLTRSIPPPMRDGKRMALSMIERYQRISRLLDVPDAGLELDLVVHDPSRERVREGLARHGVADEALLLVTPGASYGGSKLWPPRYFAEASDAIAKRHGLLPLILPAPSADEIAIAAEVSGRMRTRHVSLEPGSLEDLKAVVERATLLLSNDTGPRHVAVALDRPVITLMGATDPMHTHHLLERQRVLWEDVACRPCGLKECPIDHRCLERLAPSRVIAAAEELLG